MDLLFVALSYFRKRKFEECVATCTSILEAKGDGDHVGEAAWLLKMRALTVQVSFDDVDVMESLIDGPEPVELALTAVVDRPGTSLVFNRSQSQAQRPMSGVVRPTPSTAAHHERGGTATARRGRTGQLVTANRISRLGTASMMPHSAAFINTARLNLGHCASVRATVKSLFEYLYFVAGDVRKALELANQAVLTLSSDCESDQIYWKCAAGRCLMRLGLVRQVIQSAGGDWYVAEGAHGPLAAQLMAKAYLMMDQPMASVAVFQKASTKFPHEASLLIGQARVYEELGQLDRSVAAYKKVLTEEANSVEAMACVASHLFYNDQPELALLLYRRLLQMGVHSSRVFNNVALCCLATQQLDLVFPCLDKALMLASDVELADLWYNAGHVALASGKPDLACFCWRLALSHDRFHAEACNNLGVAAAMAGRKAEAVAHFNSASSFDPQLVEARLNLVRVAVEESDLEKARSVAGTMHLPPDLATKLKPLS